MLLQGACPSDCACSLLIPDQWQLKYSSFGGAGIPKHPAAGGHKLTHAVDGSCHPPPWRPPVRFPNRHVLSHLCTSITLIHPPTEDSSEVVVASSSSLEEVCPCAFGAAWLQVTVLLGWPRSLHPQGCPSPLFLLVGRSMPSSMPSLQKSPQFFTPSPLSNKASL